MSKTTKKTAEENMKEKETKEPEVLTPKEYFDILKGKREEATLESLQQVYDNACTLMKKYTVTGQKSGAVKLYNFATVCEKEIAAVNAGINTYVNRFDLDEYISKIASKDVVIIELENYEREIPDEIVDKLFDLKEKNIFDEYYVVFTDYTGKERKKVEQKRRDKDPILFGAMKIGNQLNTRLYYIGDWTDEFCDLTLEKMVKEFKSDCNHKYDPTKDIKSLYPTLDEFKKAFENNKE